MEAAAEAFFAMSAGQRREVHLRLCEHALRVWEQHFPAGRQLQYRESVAGTVQELDVGLPRETLVSIRAGRDLADIEARYGEPIAALQDRDLELWDEAEFAFYAIYNAFQLHVLGKSIEDWLIVSQVLSSIGDRNPIRVLQKAIADVRDSLAKSSFAAVHEGNDPRPMYARLMGSSWLQLAEPVRLLHATESTVRAGGRLRIEHGRGPLARFLASLLGLPRASDSAETHLIVTAGADGERWLRTFEGRRLATRQYQVGECGLAERFGVMEFRFRLETSEGSLLYRQLASAFVFGPVRLRFPALIAPRIEAREDPAGAHQIRVHVSVALPLVGPVVTYDGLIDIEEFRT